MKLNIYADALVFDGRYLITYSIDDDMPIDTEIMEIVFIDANEFKPLDTSGFKNV